MQQTIKTVSGRLLILPTAEENAQINAGIAADPDTYELSDDEIARLEPYRQSVTLSLPFDVIGAFQETGTEWQNLMATALRQWLQEHPNRV